jgi:hypothetical protein
MRRSMIRTTCTNRVESSMNRRRELALVFSVCLLLSVGVLLGGCGGGEGDADAHLAATSGSGGLRPEDVRPALSNLPYKIELKQVHPSVHDNAAFLGTAVGPHHTVVKFSIGLGAEAFAIPLPGIGTVHAVSNGAAGFAFNDNTAVPADFPTKAQWNEAPRMAVDMEESLCRKATGKPCQDRRGPGPGGLLRREASRTSSRPLRLTSPSRSWPGTWRRSAGTRPSADPSRTVRDRRATCGP